MTTPLPILREHLPGLFTPRLRDTHKGSFGTLGIVGGGPGMTGAALLAARAALRIGAGKVFVGFAQDTLPLACDPMQLELMLRTGRDLVTQAGPLGLTTWVAGCGLGTTPDAAALLSELFATRGPAPLVLDADALNLLAQGSVQADWGPAPVILTPHAAEAGRLLGSSAAQVQADRYASAQALARQYKAWVVLKGPGTLVCPPGGDICYINTTGNPGLASAGTGDVLAGFLGSLLAQGLSPDQAVPGAVWLHGAAAEVLVAVGIGPIGLTAGELADAARHMRNSNNQGNARAYTPTPKHKTH